MLNFRYVIINFDTSSVYFTTVCYFIVFDNGVFIIISNSSLHIIYCHYVSAVFRKCHTIYVFRCLTIIRYYHIKI